jgi:putative nucleotidyltransferase with HDIG domain
MTKQELFNLIEQSLLIDERPSEFLNKLKEKGLLDIVPFCNLKDLEKLQQTEKHHPEGNVWVHTMMVVDEGAKHRDEATNKRELMWALLLHDIGKIKTTKFQKGHWTAYNHDKVGEEESLIFLSHFNNELEFNQRVSKLIRYHMHLLYLIKKLPFTDLDGLKKYTDINDLSIVFLADRLGRGGLCQSDINEIKLEINNFYKQYI